MAILEEEEASDDLVETTSVRIGPTGTRWQPDALREAASFARQRERAEAEAGPGAFDTEDEETLYERELRGADKHIPRSMVGAASAMVVASIALTVVGGPLYGLAERASADLLDPDVYVHTVLPGDEHR